MSKEDQDFINMVAYFWDRSEDPTRYCHWDEDRCRRLMPAFWSSWINYKAFKLAADMAAEYYEKV